MGHRAEVRGQKKRTRDEGRRVRERAERTWGGGARAKEIKE